MIKPIVKINGQKLSNEVRKYLKLSCDNILFDKEKVNPNQHNKCKQVSNTLGNMGTGYNCEIRGCEPPTASMQYKQCTFPPTNPLDRNDKNLKI